jgi:hypothetical protein
MKSQAWQFLKLLLVVVIGIHLVIGAVLLVSWLSGRNHATGSVAPPSMTQKQ